MKLTGAATDALRNHLKRQMGDVDRLGDLHRDQGLVFASDSGAPLIPSNIRNRNVRRLTSKAKLPEIRSHPMGPIPSMSLSACAKATPRVCLGRDLLSIYCYLKP